LRYRRAAILSIATLALAGCGGGSGGGVGPPAAPTQASQSQSIGAAGGSVSTTLGTQTVNVKVPAGAVATTATFTLTVYSSAAAPKPLSRARQTQSVRATRAVSSDAVLIVSFTLTDGGVPLLKPLQASVTTAAAASGSVFRLAGYGTNGFGDVDTATWTNGVATEDDNPKYAGATLAADTLYAFYTTAAPLAPPTFVVTVSGPTPVGTISTATYSALETDGNGFPILPAPALTFSVDTPALGTINPSTGALATGPSDGSGHVVATDASRGVSGKLAIAVSGSVRPAGSGDTFSYTGTMTTVLTVDQASQPNGTTTPVTSTTTAGVNETVASLGTTDGVHYFLNTDEVDQAALTTLETKTETSLAYQSTGPNRYVVRVVSSTSKEPATQVNYQTLYGPNNGALTAIPESAGTTLTNDAQSTYLENDPGNPGYDGQGNPTPTITREADPKNQYRMSIWTLGFEGYYEQSSSGLGIAQVLFNGSPIEFDFEPVAPDPSSPFSVKDDILINIYALNAGRQKVGFLGSELAYPWYGTSVPATLFSDTVTITPQSTLDPSCTTYGTNTTATLVQEQHTSLDVALGQTETRSVKSFDVAGPGTVCTVLSDTVKTYYDYSSQSGPYVVFTPDSTTPTETDSVTETLSLATTTAKSAGRSTQSVAAGPQLPVSAALRARFDHVVAQIRQKQANRFATYSRTLRGTH
jgi:hypothetical protein